ADASSPSVDIYRGQTRIRSIIMNPLNNGRFETAIKELEDGDYTLRLSSVSSTFGESSVDYQIPLYVGQANVEMNTLDGDEQLLRSIADATGGEFMRFADLPQLPEKLARKRSERS